MNLLKLSWKNLTHKPLTMLLSLILFALGVGLISLLLQINQQVQEKFEKNLANIDLVIGAKGSPLQMILCNMYHIDNPTGNISIKEARPFLNPKHPLIRLAVPLSLGDSYRNFRIVGTTHEILDSIYPSQLAAGKRWERDMEVTIGAIVAEETGLKVGDQFHSSHGFMDDGVNVHDHGSGFQVVGILEASGTVADQLILCNNRSIWLVHEHEEEQPVTDSAQIAQHNHDHDHDHSHDHAGHSKPLIEEVDKDITSVLIRYKSRTNWRALNMPRSINENTDMQAASPAYEIARLTDMMGTGEKILRQLALIIVIVSGLSIFISLFSSLKDRKYELALMRVMGATPGKIFMLIILEGLILAFLGYLLGIVISHLGLEFFGRYLEASHRYSFNAFQLMKEELWLLGGALLIGLIAAILPAIQASRTDISETLTDS